MQRHQHVATANTTIIEPAVPPLQHHAASEGLLQQTMLQSGQLLPQQLQQQQKRMQQSMRPVWFPCAMAGLCVFMAAWTLVLPASWKVGLVPGHLEPTPFKDLPHLPVPEDVVLGKAPYPFFRYCHGLASGVWSVLAVAQLATGMRFGRGGTAGGAAAVVRAWHRRLGYACFALGAVVVLGVLSLDRAGGINYGKHTGAALLSYRLLLAWFCLTALAAGRAATRRDFGAHERWVVRHMASAMWVGVQRTVMVPLVGGLHIAGLADWSEPEAKAGGFLLASLLAVVLTLAACEAYLLLLRRWQARQRQARGGAAASSGATATHKSSKAS